MKPNESNALAIFNLCIFIVLGLVMFLTIATGYHTHIQGVTADKYCELFGGTEHIMNIDQNIRNGTFRCYNQSSGEYLEEMTYSDARKKLKIEAKRIENEKYEK